MLSPEEQGGAMGRNVSGHIAVLLDAYRIQKHQKQPACQRHKDEHTSPVL
jgi:hypothetical protein